jgi:hypothetical protein
MNGKSTIELYNIRTKKVIRTFESRKTADQFRRLYNDLAGRSAFNTREVK